MAADRACLGNLLCCGRVRNWHGRRPQPASLGQTGLPSPCAALVSLPRPQCAPHAPAPWPDPAPLPAHGSPSRTAASSPAPSTLCSLWASPTRVKGTPLTSRGIQVGGLYHVHSVVHLPLLPGSGTFLITPVPPSPTRQHRPPLFVCTAVDFSHKWKAPAWPFVSASLPERPAPPAARRPPRPTPPLPSLGGRAFSVHSSWWTRGAFPRFGCCARSQTSFGWNPVFGSLGSLPTKGSGGRPHSAPKKGPGGVEVKEHSWGPACLLLVPRRSASCARVGPATQRPQFRTGVPGRGRGLQADSQV